MNGSLDVRHAMQEHRQEELLKMSLIIGIWELYISLMNVYVYKFVGIKRKKSGLDTPSNPLYNQKYSIKHEVILP